MSLRQRNMNLVGVIAFVGLGLLGNTGCSGEAPLPPPAPSGGETPAASGGLQAIGEAVGTVQDGHLEFSAVTPIGTSAPGVQTENFGKTFQQSVMTFATPAGGPGALGCTASQYCAQVNLTNGSALVMDNTFVEVTDYFNVKPTGSTITWAGPAFPFTTTAYTSVFVHPTSIAAAAYNTLAAGGTGSVIWKFNAGASTFFNFHVKIYASFERTGLNSTIGHGAGVTSQAVDACGATVPTIFNNNIGNDDTETQVVLPFAYTFLNKTYDKAAVGSNGYIQLYSSTDAGPPTPLPATNSSIFTTGPVGLFPFWDDLAFGADGGVCITTTGAAPTRTWSITWKNARVSSNQPTKPGTFFPDEFSFSLALSETNDYTRFYYLTPAAITSQTRGVSSSCGYRPPAPASKFGITCGFNNSWLGATAASYPQLDVIQEGPSNP